MIVSTAATGLRSNAVAATEKPSPYLLELAEHFRHEVEVRFDEREAVIPLAAGVALLRAGDAALELTVAAHMPADLRRVEEIVGGHLERLGRRDGLEVRWNRGERRWGSADARLVRRRPSRGRRARHLRDRTRPRTDDD